MNTTAKALQHADAANHQLHEADRLMANGKHEYAHVLIERAKANVWRICSALRGINAGAIINADSAYKSAPIEELPITTRMEDLADMADNNALAALHRDIQEHNVIQEQQAEQERKQ